LLVDDQHRRVVDPLLPRDLVARAIARYRRERGPVYLTLRHLDPDVLRERFGPLADQLAVWDLDLARDLLPVAPAAHYCMGGVRSDAVGRTDVPGLYVAGEVACTGAQGANRLASNSLLECLVFGRLAAQAALADEPAVSASWPAGDLPGLDGTFGSAGRQRCNSETQRGLLPASLVDMEKQREGTGTDMGDGPSDGALGAALDHDLGVERSATGLTALYAGLHGRLAGARLVARLATAAALLRQESRGAHSRSDYPATATAWQGRILWRRDTAPSFERIQ
jgi:L-aspartate oxidase